MRAGAAPSSGGGAGGGGGGIRGGGERAARPAGVGVQDPAAADAAAATGFEGARGPGGHRARGWGSAAPKTGSRLPGIDIDDATEFPSLVPRGRRARRREQRHARRRRRRQGWGGMAPRRRLENELGPPSPAASPPMPTPTPNDDDDARPASALEPKPRKPPKRVAPVAMNPTNPSIGGTSQPTKRIQPTAMASSEVCGALAGQSQSLTGLESPVRPSANAPKLSSPGPLTPPPLRRDSPVSNRLATAASSSSLPTSFSPMNDGLGSGFGGGGFDEFGAASDENDTDEEDEEDEEDSDGGSSSSLSGPSPEALQ